LLTPAIASQQQELCSPPKPELTALQSLLTTAGDRSRAEGWGHHLGGQEGILRVTLSTLIV